MMHTAEKFVLFPIGGRRFALPAESVCELARPDRLHSFPHTMRLFTGVLLRRGRIVPVCDVAPVLVGPAAPSGRYYLIADRRLEGASEWTAIPVTGECELTAGEMIGPNEGHPDYVRALLPLEGEIVQVLDLEKLIANGGRA